ncbi:MAG TPA: NADH-quinone oxidoreductase subunit NuoK [Chloroflexi bacterium]|nr:NADH-quinone oxidoreductase subunit NuoK [Chloroflexota bacterium]
MIYGIPLEWYLILAAVLFCIGIYGVLARRNAVVTLMCIELMLNAVNINLLAFWRYLEPGGALGQAFVVFVYVVTIAAAGVGLALIVALWRTHATVNLEDVNRLAG